MARDFFCYVIKNIKINSNCEPCARAYQGRLAGKKRYAEMEKRMKHFKKIAGVLLAMIMLLGLTTTALAATVTNQTEHSYSAYQIFSGTQEDNAIPLGDAEWGSGVDGTALLVELKTDTRFVLTGDDNLFKDCTTALEVAAVLGNYADNSDVAKAFANVAAKHLTGSGTPIAANATEVTLNAGYYLLVDTTTLTDGDAKNSALLQVTNQGNITIDKKYDVPTADKSVQDSDNTWGEAADWEVGSAVPFQLTGTLPTNLADYEIYKYVFHDTLSDGLKYKGDAKVFVDNTADGGTKTELTTGFIITPSAAATAGGGTLTVTFDDLKSVTGVSATSKLIVEYTAELLDTAVVGSTGNNNTVYVEYSNDPNTTGGTTTGKTLEDEVKVFTYELDVTKVDGKQKGSSGNYTKMLKDANFVLLNDDKTKVAKVTGGVFTGWVAVPTADSDGKITYPDGTTLTSGVDGKFIIKGLDAGSYNLRETKAPAGYNLLKSDISLTITATLNKAETTPALTALTLTVNRGTPVNGALDTGIVATDVENNSGIQLPETGGMGTTLFYMLGGALVLVSVVLLVTKKRMRDKER